MTACSERRYAVVAVEGNGHKPPDLVELAVVPVTHGAIGQPVTWLFHPDQPITPLARRIHGITDEMVAGLPAVDIPEVAALGTRLSESRVLCQEFNRLAVAKPANSVCCRDKARRRYPPWREENR